MTEMHVPVHHPRHGLDPGLLVDLVARAFDPHVVWDRVFGINVIARTRAVRIRRRAVRLRIIVCSCCRCSTSEPKEGKEEEEGKVESLHLGRIV